MLHYCEMTMDHYGQSLELWKRTEGLGLSEADSKPAIAAYLARNPGMSWVCVDDAGTVVGTALCGHDGRRGYLYHVAVSASYRNRSIGTTLVMYCLERLLSEGIDRCHLFVIADNEIGSRFWSKAGWMRRDGILRYSRDTREAADR